MAFAKVRFGLTIRPNDITFLLSNLKPCGFNLNFYIYLRTNALHTYVHTRTDARTTHTRTNTHAHTRTHARTHARTLARSHTHTHDHVDRLVESCGTSRLELLQPGFSNLNSIFNIYMFVADLPGDTVDKILALETSRGSTHVSSLSLIAHQSSPSVFIIEGDSSLWWSTSNKVALSSQQCPLSVSNNYGGSMPKSMLIQHNTKYSPWTMTVPNKCCLNVQQQRNRASYD